MWEVRVTPCGEFDNHPFESDHFETRPLTSAMGAEVVGVRLPELSDEGFEDFKRALYHHKMLFVRDQHLSHAEHEQWAARLGPFAVDAYTQGVLGHREVHPIIKEADTRAASLFGGGWHTDSPFLPEPPAITTLRQVEGPPYGGDTSWTNCALAFRHLSKTYQDMLRPLRVWMSAANNYATQEKLMGKAIQFADAEQFEQGKRGSYHPLVRKHPETGKESLYICDTYAAGIEGMTTHEAKPLIDFLVAHTTQHAFTCRLRWEPGMVALWDNRLTMHLGPNDYDGWRREMYRTTTQARSQSEPLPQGLVDQPRCASGSRGSLPEGRILMRKLVLALLPFTMLAGCSSEPADEAVTEEPVAAEPAAMTAANGSPAGAYEATAADGTVTTTTLNADGTYTDVDAEGNTVAAGTWAVTDGKTCFSPTTEGAEPMCYTESEPGADGSFTATPDEGEPVTVRPAAA